MKPISCLATLPVLLAHLPALACTPPSPIDEAGFVRAHVTALPKNARGVMFMPTSRNVRPTDFLLTSGTNQRPIPLTVRRFKDAWWVRIEPAGGFTPGTRYRFRYLPAHGSWRYPDKVDVTIGSDIVDLSGKYEIELAPRAEPRMITTVTSNGSCTAPVTAIVREFSYELPPSAAHYRDALEYAARLRGPLAHNAGFIDAAQPLWSPGPLLYARHAAPRLGTDAGYTNANDAVVAPCGHRAWPRTVLRGAVSFPEVDVALHRTAAVNVDLNGAAATQCTPLTSLIGTMERFTPARALRYVCHPYLGMSYHMGETSLAQRPIEEWELQLSFLFDHSPTCNLVALATLWRDRNVPVDGQTAGRLGDALRQGMASADPAQRRQVIDALHYLAVQLHDGGRTRLTHDLIAPLRSALARELATPHPYRSDQLGYLLKTGDTTAP